MADIRQNGPALSVEVLNHIFSFSDTNSRARCMSVCRWWLSVIEPKLWHTVDSSKQFIGLLNVLGDWSFHANYPLTQDLTVTFMNKPRFMELSSLVLCLTADMRNKAIALMLQLIPHLRLQDAMPKLKRLHCKVHDGPGSLLFSMAFIHSGLTSLVIDFGTVSPMTFDFSALPYHCIPNIRLLEIRGSHEKLNSVWYLQTLIENLSQVEIVVIPRWRATPANIYWFSYLPKLREIRTNKTNVRSIRQDEDVVYCRILCAGRLKSLYALSLSSTPEFIESTLQSPDFAEADLHTLSLEMFGTTRWPADTTDQYLSVVSSNYKSLREFSVRDPSTTAPAFSILSSILFNSLTRLKFHFHTPIFMTDEDINMFARAIPSIVELSLNPRPVKDRTSLPLPSSRILESFARHCPRLRKFGVMFDTLNINDSDNDFILNRFVALQKLDIGDSPIPREHHHAMKFAILLAKVLPPNMVFTASSPTSERIWEPVMSRLELSRRLMKVGAPIERLCGSKALSS